MTASKKKRTKLQEKEEFYFCKGCEAVIGNYLILDHLVTGGMAKIYRAKRYDKTEADRIVAIKVIQPQFLNDPSFRQMFMGEIKTSFGLVHPNISQIYDYGMHNEQLYIAMEYIDGKSLDELNKELIKRGFSYPVEIAIYVISQVCQGLFYAHTLVDKLTGKGANIVHRDISPHNIMISYDGSVKVIDFGIAKSEIDFNETVAKGTIKGKLPYLAPEYLEDMGLDHRYDQFSLGVTFWEMLCGRRLFQAEHDLGILRKIQECSVPAPSTINQNVPPELDEIVLKALSKNRDDRYQNMDQLNRALVKLLYAKYDNFNPSDLACFYQRFFKQDIIKDRERLVEFGKLDLTVCAAQYANKEVPDLVTKQEKVLEANITETLSIEDSDNFKTKEINLDRTVKTKKNRQSTNKYKIQKEEKYRDLGWMGTIVKLGMVVLAVWLGFFFFREESKKIIAIVKKYSKEEAISAPVGEIKQKKVDEIVDGKIIIKNYKRENHRVYVDGKEYKGSLFGDIDYGKKGKHFLRVEEKGLQHFITDFSLNSENSVFEVTIPKMPSVEYGYLVTTAPCITGKLYFDMFGEKRVEDLPLEQRIAFPVNSDIDVFYQQEGTDQKIKIQIKVGVNDLTDLCESREIMFP